MKEKTYIAIDLKSFYASVECLELGLNPLTENLVVADKSRTEKTICLAVSPALKTFGIPGRPRLFEVIQKVNDINRERKRKAKNRRLEGSSTNIEALATNENLALDYLVVPPRMATYMKYSTQIYQIYLEYVAPEDVHVYSIDEVFIDATDYLLLYRLSAHDFALKLIKEVLKRTGVTATCGIGSNLYLCKVAMDIMAKHIPPDKDGVRIAELDEKSYRKQLWNHTPITDFWRVGAGYKKSLEKLAIYTMGDIARCSISKNPFWNEDVLYDTFGINAELLIDHAWGHEPCTIADIKRYQPQSTSMGAGQVLTCPYPFEKGKLVVKEMAEQLSLDLVKKGLVTDQIVLTVGYDVDNANYRGEITVDRYGRILPKQAHGSENIGKFTSSSKLILSATQTLFDRIVDKNLQIRRLNLVANHTLTEEEGKKFGAQQLDLFTDLQALKQEDETLQKEKRGQEAVVAIQEKYGKNAILKGISMEDGATAKERNGQIGGHKA